MEKSYGESNQQTRQRKIHFINNKARKLIFNSFISSHIRYGIKVWGGIRGRTRHKLNMSFKKAVRSLDIGKIHTEPILKKYKLLTIDQIYKNDLNLIAWEYFNGGIPEAIKIIFYIEMWKGS